MKNNGKEERGKVQGLEFQKRNDAREKIEKIRKQTKRKTAKNLGKTETLIDSPTAGARAEKQMQSKLKARE